MAEPWLSWGLLRVCILVAQGEHSAEGLHDLCQMNRIYRAEASMLKGTRVRWRHHFLLWSVDSVDKREASEEFAMPVWNGKSLDSHTLPLSFPYRLVRALAIYTNWRTVGGSKPLRTYVLYLLLVCLLTCSLYCIWLNSPPDKKLNKSIHTLSLKTANL